MPGRPKVTAGIISTIRFTLPLLAGENILLARVMWYAPLERTVDHNQVNGPTSVMSFQHEPLFFLESVGRGAGSFHRPCRLAGLLGSRHRTHQLPAAWQGGGVEQYDGALACCDWATTGGKDWPAAAVRFSSSINPFGEISPLILKERPIPSLYQRPLSPYPDTAHTPGRRRVVLCRRRGDRARRPCAGAGAGL